MLVRQSAADNAADSVRRLCSFLAGAAPSRLHGDVSMGINKLNMSIKVIEGVSLNPPPPPPLLFRASVWGSTTARVMRY